MNRRRLFLGFVVALVVLVGLGVAGVFALPGIIRWAAVSQLGKATGRAVTLDAVETSLYHGRLALRGLRIMDRDGGPLATLDRAEVRFSPRDLLRLHTRIIDATVQTLTVRIVRTGPNQFNVSDLMARRAAKGGEAPALTIERFALTGGSVVIEDRTLTPPRTWRVDAVEFLVRGASTVAGAPPGEATLSAVAAGAPIALTVKDVRLSPMSLKATLTARDIDASLAALYLPPQSPLSPARGKLTFTATLEQTKDGSDVALEAGFTGVELHRPGQETAYLTAPAVKVKVDGVRVRPGGIELAHLAVDGGAVVLEDTRLKPVRRWQVDGIALEARNLSSARNAPPGMASARAATAGARLEVWVGNVRLAPLELDATAIVRNIDLSLVRLYLPPELPVQPERGVVNATVRVRHDGRGTRAGLDAGLANIELQRPGHFVTAPAVRVTVEDVTLDGGAVAVGSVSVTSDRLTLEERAAKRVQAWPVQNLVVEAKGLSSRRDAVQGVASVRATVAGASASVFVTQARLQPLELRATAILRNFDAAVLKFYIPDAVPMQLGRGLVNATIEVGQTAEGTTLTADASLTGLEAQGRGAFATLGVKSPSVRLAIADARRRGEALSIGRIELTGNGALVDSRGAAARFDFSRLHLTTESLTWPVSAPARVALSMRFQDRGELDGSGTARLTAPLPTIAWSADLALKFRGVDLTPLAVYVPVAAGLGGRVRADLTANLAYAGALTAHVKGDVGGARFALMEGDRPLVTLRSINAAGLDLQWPQRMSIKQLRLREPYGLVVRDRQGAFALAARFASRETTVATAPPAPRVKRELPSMAIGEVVVENGSADLVDEGVTPAVRLNMPRLNLTLRNVTWPASAPVTVALETALPSGGTLKADGTATAEPLSVDLTVAFREADLALLQPYLGFRARVGGRLDANLTVAGALTPAPRLKIKGDAGLRALDISDGQRSVLTADRLRVTGIDADWPERVALDRVRMRRSWALIQRDEHGEFLLRNLLERPGAARSPRAAPSAPAVPAPTVPAPAAPRFEFSFREGIFEEQAATIIDGRMSPPVRLEVAGARLAVHDFTFPQKGPVKVEVKSPMPGGGKMEVAGTVQLDPMRLEARAVLDGVAIEPAQPYLPIEGRVAGNVTGDLTVKVALEPTAVQVTGQASLRAFRLNDGDRAVVTVTRAETAGIDIDWPKRITLQSVQFRRPRLLIERDAKGTFRLRQLVTPRWAAAPSVQPAAAGSRSAGVAATPPVIEIAKFSLDKALARFVDYTTTPAYAEELEDLDVTITPLTTAPGRRTRFTAKGGIGGGSFKLQGEGAYGDRPVLDMSLEIQNYIVPRANPYIDLYTSWMAQNGRLDVNGVYKLDGNQLETRHDVLVRGLEVTHIDERDEVARRVGLPFGMLVSLLKDSRGEIKLALPVSGDLSTREFDYKEAVWASVRNLSIRLIALPFSKIGSLFFSEDSKVTAVALAPVVFEPGSDRLGQGMNPHLEKVADFMRGAPAVKVVLEPILIEADVQALKRARVLSRLAAPTEAETLERAVREHRLRWPDKPVPPTLDAIVAELATAETLPPDAMRALATRRIEAVRQSITRGGGVDAARLSGRARGTPLVEAAGNPRVEFDLRS